MNDSVGQQLLGFGRVVGKTLEEHCTDQGAAHRAGGALPLDRRTGMQEVAALESEHVGRRPDVDQARRGGRHPAHCLGVGLGAARVEHHLCQGGLRPGDRRGPVDPLGRRRLGRRERPPSSSAPAVTTVAAASGRVVMRASSTSEIASRVAAALEACTIAPASTSLLTVLS